MKYLIKIHLIIFIIISFLGNGISQKGYPISSITSEIITAKGIDKLPPQSKAILSGKNGEIDIDERFYYQVRHEFVSEPEKVLPLGCFVKKLEYVIRFGESVYGPFVNEEIPQGDEPTRFSTTPRQLLIPVKNEVLDKLTSRNINDLQIIFKGIWYSKEELEKEKPQCAKLNQINKESRVDIFVLTIKKFGLLALVDVSPLSKEGAQLTLDVLSGLFKNLSKTSIDYVSVLNKPSFTNVMISIPFLKYEGRAWFYKNFELETVFVMDASDKNKANGFGLGIGALGTKDKTVKGGVFWESGKPNYYLGISIRGLGNWLSNYK